MRIERNWERKRRTGRGKVERGGGEGKKREEGVREEEKAGREGKRREGEEGKER